MKTKILINTSYILRAQELPMSYSYYIGQCSSRKFCEIHRKFYWTPQFELCLERQNQESMLGCSLLSPSPKEEFLGPFSGDGGHDHSSLGASNWD